MKLTDETKNAYPHCKCGEKRCCPNDFKDYCPPTIEDDADLIIVGEAPGEDEVGEEGFVGDSGQLLRDILTVHGITEFSLDNVLNCRPPDNRDPYVSEIKRCMNRTVENVKGHSFVLMVGNTAMNAFFPDQRAKKIRGNALHHPDFPPEMRFYGVHHPAWALRRGYKGEDTLDEEIARLRRIMTEDGPDFEMVWAGQDGEYFFERLEHHLNQRLISCDIESTGYESWKQDFRIKSVALSHNGEEILFVSEDDPQWIGAMHRLEEFITDSSKSFVGAHGGFDIEALEREFGCVAKAQCDDIFTLLHLTDNYRMPSLKQLASEELDGYRHMLPNPHLDVWSDELMGLYNSEDVAYTLELYKKGLPRLDKKQYELYKKVFGPSDLFLQRLTTDGIWHRTDYWVDLKEEMEEEIVGILREWAEEDPDFDFDLMTKTKDERIILDEGEALIRYLYDTKGLEVIATTPKSDKPKTDKDTIRELRDNHDAPELQYLLDYREINKRYNTFVKDVGEDHVDYDGRVHPGYKNTWTDSGRTSSYNVNIQNQPRDDRIRRQYGVPPGYKFVEVDASQVELRIMVSLAGQEDVIESYQRGIDAHLQTAMEITGKDDPSKITKEERTNAKPANFSLIYQPYTDKAKWTVARQAKSYGFDWSEEKCQKFVDAFYAKYDQIPKYHREVIKRMYENNGRVQDVMGFEHRYPKWEPVEGTGVPDEDRWGHWERACLNSMAQGPASFITERFGILVQERLRGRGVTCNKMVHDDIGLEVPNDVYNDIFPVMQEAVEETKSYIDDWFKVPLVMDIEVGENWGDLDELEDTSFEA